MARPKLKIAVASCSQTKFPDIEEENQGISEALSALGIGSYIHSWADPRVDWSAFDLVLIRTTWDYPQHLQDFESWLGHLDELGLPVVNPTSLIRWNLRKTYLLELEQRGVPIVPVKVVPPGSTIEASDQELVIKPSVAVGSVGAEGLMIGAKRKVSVESMVSPFLSSVHQGELSVFVIDGQCQLTVLKRPSATDWRVQPQYGGRYLLTKSDPESNEIALQAAAATSQALGLNAVPIYLRVDLLAVEQRWRVLEVEAIEPSLYCSQAAKAANGLARMVQQFLLD